MALPYRTSDPDRAVKHYLRHKSENKLSTNNQQPPEPIHSRDP